MEHRRRQMAGRKRHVRGRKGNQKKKQKTKRRLWLLFALSVLFLGCILYDCQRKGLLQKEWNKVTQPGSTEKPVSTTSGDEQMIRVLLTNDAMNSIYHDKVRISGTAELLVRQNGQTKVYDKGQTVSVSANNTKKSAKTVRISCPKGRIRVESITRSGKVQAYRGTMKLVRKKQGLILINTLSLREYLYGVVPSEMPSSYPMEALKAQAVCARSFAWRQMRSNSYKAYGADVDDTTAFQVYHMAGEDERTRRAVDRTAGKKVYSGDHVITTYYYSTSWGCSASEQEAWGTAKGSNYPVRFQTDSEDVGQGLSSEMCFYDFITGSKETYDSGYDWYRWSVTLSADTLGAKLGIGTVRKITVISRGKSGLIRKLRVRGSLGRITLEGQEEIRQKLYPSGTEITKKKSGETAVLSMLPSAAFTVLGGSEKGTRTFTLIGGGLGHGVGMSQNGAGEMARQGKNYRQILKHYYSHCKVQ